MIPSLCDRLVCYKWDNDIKISIPAAFSEFPENHHFLTPVIVSKYSKCIIYPDTYLPNYISDKNK